MAVSTWARITAFGRKTRGRVTTKSQDEVIKEAEDETKDLSAGSAAQLQYSTVKEMFGGILSVLPENDGAARNQLRALIKDMQYEYAITINSYPKQEDKDAIARDLKKEVDRLSGFVKEYNGAGTDVGKKAAINKYIWNDNGAKVKFMLSQFSRILLKIAVLVALALGGAKLLALALPEGVQAAFASGGIAEKVGIILGIATLPAAGTAAHLSRKNAPSTGNFKSLMWHVDNSLFNRFVSHQQCIAEAAETELDAPRQGL